MNTAKQSVYAAVLLAIGASQAVWAAEYTIDSALKVSVQHDDNINLEVENQDSLYGEIINPSAKVKIRSENWSTSLNTDLKFSDFNREGYSSDDQNITLKSDREGERYSFSVLGRATHDTTRTSENEDSGRFSNARRKFYSLAPTASYLMSEKHQLTVSATLDTVDYLSENYTGYDNAQAYAEWAYVYAENLRYFLRANVSEYESDARAEIFRFIQVPTGADPTVLFREQSYTTNTSSTGFQLGADYQVNKKLSLFGLFGSSELDTDYDVNDSFCTSTADDPSWIERGGCSLAAQSSSSKLIDTRASWNEQRYKLSLAYTLQTQPSSDGYMLEFEKVKLNWNYKLGENNSINLGAVWGQNDSLSDSNEDLLSGRSNREYQSASLSYRHRLNENWQISADFRYRYQERETDSAAAEGSGGWISVTYRPQVKQWSR